ncbi:MAG: ECF-type sigma factor [Gemmatimonadaceae bacterium]
MTSRKIPNSEDPSGERLPGKSHSIDPADLVSDSGDVTVWLQRLRDQRTDAHDALAPLVYDELHRLAVRVMRGEQSPVTLQPTALVHEAWMRLVEQHSAQFRNRAHFFSIAVRLMRRVLVDQARRRTAAKRDGGVYVSLDDIDIALPQSNNADEVLRVHEALHKLAAMNERQAQVVELRFFAGLSSEEVAAVLDVSLATVKRDWAVARAWLQRELSENA